MLSPAPFITRRVHIFFPLMKTIRFRGQRHIFLHTCTATIVFRFSGWLSIVTTQSIRTLEAFEVTSEILNFIFNADQQKPTCRFLSVSKYAKLKTCLCTCGFPIVRPKPIEFFGSWGFTDARSNAEWEYPKFLYVTGDDSNVLLSKMEYEQRFEPL